MKIALVGYGKMGHMIEQAARDKGHVIVCTVDLFAEDATCITNDTSQMVQAIKDSGAEGIIEFSHPASVMANLTALIPLRLPLVVGTTGWKDNLAQITEQVEQNKTALLHASNFSVGVNLFYRIVAEAARLVSQFDAYDTGLFESHHNQKVDSPSGTLLDIAKKVLENMPSKKRLITNCSQNKPESDELHLASVRVGSVPGTHTVWFDSPADTIELTHTARNREGFALGAVRALEWLSTSGLDNKPRAGVFTMDDVFSEL
ncbi:MAG TPA: 4-hydroxy-tetrahydrodipicolinate reductase [Treponema sp.]|nr:4-hydroxy-tetrahydrodipicolinate reductase [Treponema sp.]